MSKKAFSLIELSIVLLIIAIIIAGVTQSSSLLAKAKLQSAQSATLNSPVAGIPDLIMWFETTSDKSFATTDGSTQTEDGTQITTWNDINPQSSTGVHSSFLRYGQGISYRINGINGLPSLDIHNSDIDFGDNDGYPKISAPQTMFVVFMVHEGGVNFAYYNENYFAFVAEESERYLNTISGPNMVDDAFSIVDSAMTASMTNDGLYANLYINGKNGVSNAASAIMTAGRLNITFEMGSGYLSEVILFDRVLKDEERQAVEQYLGKKYGVNVVKENRPTI
jgi:prepilin-type N-terminal cleavage/methylation domain-containing protein